MGWGLISPALGRLHGNTLPLQTPFVTDAFKRVGPALKMARNCGTGTKLGQDVSRMSWACPPTDGPAPGVGGPVLWSPQDGVGGTLGEGTLGTSSVLWISGGRWTVFNRLYCPLRASLRRQYHLPAAEEENEVCERILLVIILCGILIRCLIGVC